MGKTVAEGALDGTRATGVADKISSAFRIAPLPFRIPVPCLHGEFGVQAIADGPKSGGEHLADMRGAEKRADGIERVTVYTCAEREDRAEAIGDVTGCDIDGGNLRRRLAGKENKANHCREIRLG